MARIENTSLFSMLNGDMLHFCTVIVTLGVSGTRRQNYMGLTLECLDVPNGQIHLMNCFMSFL